MYHVSFDSSNTPDTGQDIWTSTNVSFSQLFNPSPDVVWTEGSDTYIMKFGLTDGQDVNDTHNILSWKAKSEANPTFTLQNITTSVATNWPVSGNTLNRVQAYQCAVAPNTNSLWLFVGDNGWWEAYIHSMANFSSSWEAPKYIYGSPYAPTAFTHKWIMDGMGSGNSFDGGIVYNRGGQDYIAYRESNDILIAPLPVAPAIEVDHTFDFITIKTTARDHTFDFITQAVAGVQTRDHSFDFIARKEEAEEHTFDFITNQTRILNHQLDFNTFKEVNLAATVDLSVSTTVGDPTSNTVERDIVGKGVVPVGPHRRKIYYPDHKVIRRDGLN